MMNELPLESKRSYRGGVWFVFNHKNDSIRLWLSSFNGQEKIYFNDELLIESKSLTKTKLSHEFKRPNGDIYRVRLKLKIAKRTVTKICTLFLNEEAIKEIQLKQKETQSKQIRVVAYSFFFILTICLILVNLHLAPKLILFIPPTIFISALWYGINRGKFGMIFQDTTEFIDE